MNGANTCNDNSDSLLVQFLQLSYILVFNYALLRVTS